MAVSLSLALSIGSPAWAQSRPRPSAPAPPTYMGLSRDDEQTAQRTMNKYAGCLLRTFRKRALAYLRLPPASLESIAAARKLATGWCLREGALGFRFPLLRGGLYEALYEEQFKRAGPAGLPAVPPIDYTGGNPAPLSDETAVAIALVQFADCVARANPTASRALILSKVASDEERAAFASLTPHLGGCLVSGTQLKFSRPMLRGFVAEALYRLSAAAARPQ
ncbi:MAG TPA: hypothetical protein VF582_06080 [Allosphingosinicella sp.]|jgi:hypothetical protein